MDEQKLQEMMASGVDPEQLDQIMAAEQQQGAPQGAPQEMPQEMPQGAPEGDPEGMPQEEGPAEADPSADKFYQEKMLSHMDAIRGEMDENPDFKDGLAKSRIGPELISEVAHWSKDRVIDLVKDLVEDPSLAESLHQAYQESTFHGRNVIEQWREDKYHGGSKDVPMDEESGPLAPIGEETAPDMDEEAGPSAMPSDEDDYIRSISGKAKK